MEDDVLATSKPVRRTLRRASRWVAGLVSVLFLGIVLYVALIAWPTPLFSHAERFGAFRVHADEPIPAEVSLVIEDLTRRIEAMEHPPIDATQRIFLCDSLRLYTFFASLLRKNPDSLAIGLGLTNETFVSMTKVRRMASTNHGRLRHTRFEGNLAEVIAHEIAHFNSLHALGYRAHLAQPWWKSEGWAEYQANLAAIRADSSYDLVARIDHLLDDSSWQNARGRALWESQLLVEYLGEIEGYRLADLVRDEVTESDVRVRMLAWHASREREAISSE